MKSSRGSIREFPDSRKELAADYTDYADSVLSAESA